MIKRIYFLFGLCFILFSITDTAASNTTYKVTVEVSEVYVARVTLKPQHELYDNKDLGPIEVFNGKAVVEVPKSLLPCQFKIYIEYATAAGDKQPKSEEFAFFMGNDDMHFKVNPASVRNTLEWVVDKENTAHQNFNRENFGHRQKVEILQKLLFVFDENSDFRKNAIKEFETQRQEYNRWLDSMVNENKHLFVSNIWALQKIPLSNKNLFGEEAVNDIIAHFFDNINFDNTLLLQSNVMSEIMGQFIGLHSMAASKEERDSKFVEAGKLACDKASKGHPKFYGWMVDYFFMGYEQMGLDKGTEILYPHVIKPNCLSRKKQKILKRIEGMQKLLPGSVIPNFDAVNLEGKTFNISNYKTDKNTLIVFFDSDCNHCNKLLDDLKNWYYSESNNEWFSLITIGLDERMEAWKGYAKNLSEDWINLYAIGGLGSRVARDYYILSTPTMITFDHEGRITGFPRSIDEIE